MLKYILTFNWLNATISNWVFFVGLKLIKLRICPIICLLFRIIWILTKHILFVIILKTANSLFAK